VLSAYLLANAPLEYNYALACLRAGRECEVRLADDLIQARYSDIGAPRLPIRHDDGSPTARVALGLFRFLRRGFGLLRLRIEVQLAGPVRELIPPVRRVSRRSAFLKYTTEIQSR